MSSDLAMVEEKARASIAAAERRAPPSRATIESAQGAEQNARAELGRLWRKSQAITEELASLRSPRRTWMHWKPQLDGQRIQELSKQRDDLREQMRAAEPHLLAAMADVERAQRAFQQEEAAERGERAAEIADARAALAYAARARRIVYFWPAVANCSAHLVFSFGRRIESAREKRRQLRDPFATDIWGLPLQP
jgi:multidrug efflux pump subunit AcrA (membrane-fusion protein)